MILSSVIYARYIQGRSTANSSEALKKSELESNEEVKRRRTEILGGNSSLLSPSAGSNDIKIEADKEENQFEAAIGSVMKWSTEQFSKVA